MVLKILEYLALFLVGSDRLNKKGVGVTVDGPKGVGGKVEVPKVDDHFKVDGPYERGRSRVKSIDEKSTVRTKSVRCFGIKWTVLKWHIFLSVRTG